MVYYRSIKSGNLLVRRPNMFHWRGTFFSVLVDIESNALYDDPEDSFAECVGITSSLNKSLIEEVK